MKRLACLALLWCAGCRAPAAPDAGFLEDPSVLQEEPGKPFDRSWFKPGVDLRTYREVYLAAVDTSHLLQQDWWSKASLSKRPQATEAELLGGYFLDQLREKFQKTNGARIVEAPGPGVLVIELAIVEVVPTKAWLNIIGYATIGALSHGATSFEGRMKDGGTGELIAEFKDREYGKFAPVTVADLTWYAHSRETIRGWAGEIVELCEAAPDAPVRKSSTVTLKPW